MSKSEFMDAFNIWMRERNLGILHASALLGVSKLRVHLYQTGWFVFDERRETLVLARAWIVSNKAIVAPVMGDYI
jgi:hypothetical protein